MSMSINGSAAAVRSREAVESQMESKSLNVEQKKQICLAALKNKTISSEEAVRMLVKCGVPMMEAVNTVNNSYQEEKPNFVEQTSAKDAWNNVRNQIGKIFGDMFTKKSE